MDKYREFFNDIDIYSNDISFIKSSYLEDYKMHLKKLVKKYGAIDKHKAKCSFFLRSFREELGQKPEVFARTINLSVNIINNCEQAKSLLTYSNLMDSNAAFNEYNKSINYKYKDDSFLKVMTGLMDARDIYILSSSTIELVDALEAPSPKTRITHSMEVFDIARAYEKNSVMKLYNQLSSTDQTKIMERMEYIISTYEDELAIPTKRIAVLGQTACGNPIEAIAIADEFIETNELKASFALRAIGDSMSPLINDGDMILIKQTDELEVNDIGIFQINESGFSDDEEVTCKMLKSIKDGIMTLVPLNAAHDPIVVDTKKQHVKIIGKYLCRA